MCMGLFQTGMLHIPRNETNTRDGCKRLPFSFLAGIFKSKKSQDDQSNIEFEDPSSVVDMDRSSDHHSKLILSECLKINFRYSCWCQVQRCIYETSVERMIMLFQLLLHASWKVYISIMLTKCNADNLQESKTKLVITPANY